MVKLIGIDWGTSSLRITQLGDAGRVLERRESDQGLMQIADGDFAGTLTKLAGDWIEPDTAVVASGMVTSQQGWHEVAYVSCPAALSTLADNMQVVQTSNGANVHLVPGVDCVRADGLPDVMRGEETQLLGCRARAGDVIVMPGTHSKWVLMNDAGIETFYTCITGELFGVLKAHSILGRLMSDSEDNQDAFESALQRARDSKGRVIADLFGARTLPLTNKMPPSSVESWLSGLLLGAEIVEMTQGETPIARALKAAPRLTVIGAPALAQRYVDALGFFDIDARLPESDVTALGHWEIATSRGLV